MDCEDQATGTVTVLNFKNSLTSKHNIRNSNTARFNIICVSNIKKMESNLGIYFVLFRDIVISIRANYVSGLFRGLCWAHPKIGNRTFASLDCIYILENN